MGENRKAIIILCFIAIMSLTITFCLEFKWYKFIINLSMTHCSFWINLSMGIFCSALLALAVAIISYHVKKKELLNEYWLMIEHHLQLINIFGLTYFYKQNNETLVSSLKNSDYLAKDVAELQIGYTNLALQKSKINLLKTNTKLGRTLNEINMLLGLINIEITEINKISMIDLSLNEINLAINNFNKENSNTDQLIQKNNKFRKLLEIEIYNPNLMED